MTPQVEIVQGDGPILLGLPHTGVHIPSDIAATLNPRGQEMADTDWHIHKLYEGLAEGTSCVRTPIHRYVIDMNRDPAGQSLYPGQNTTGLCPTTDFDGQPIYAGGSEPDSDEIERRRLAYHAPYHAALAAEMARIKARHGVAILYDCHSIRSQIPFLFEGRLPDFNIGTNGGRTCDPKIERALVDVCAAATGHSWVLNGRFKGGWTTRHYGTPAKGWHAIQMELAQSTYLEAETAPWTWAPAKAQALRDHLRRILEALTKLAPQLGDLK